MTQPMIAVNGASKLTCVNAMSSAADSVIVFPEFLVYEDPLPNQKEFVDLVMKDMPACGRGTPDPSAWDAMQRRWFRRWRRSASDAGNEKLNEAVRGPYTRVTTQYDFAAPDMTGITLSGYIFSKLVNGVYTRTSFRICKD